MAETQSFTIKTLTPTNKVIDQVLQGLTVDCNLPAVIEIESVSVSTRRVGSRSTLTFKLTLPTEYSQGGYLLVTLPSTLSIDQASFQCILLIGFNSDNGFCSMPTEDTIMLYDAINQKELVFAISGVINPPNTKPTDNFSILADDPDDNIIAYSKSLPSFGYTPIPGSISSVTSTRSVYVVG